VLPDAVAERIAEYTLRILPEGIWESDERINYDISAAPFAAREGWFVYDTNPIDDDEDDHTVHARHYDYDHEGVLINRQAQCLALNFECTAFAIGTMREVQLCSLLDSQEIRWLDFKEEEEEKDTEEPAEEPQPSCCNVLALTFSHDDQLIAAACMDVGIIIWRCDDGTSTQLKCPDHLQCIRFSADDMSLWTVGWKDDELAQWNIAAGKKMRTLTAGDAAYDNPTAYLVQSSDGRYLALTDEHFLRVFDAHSGAILLKDVAKAEMVVEFTTTNCETRLLGCAFEEVDGHYGQSETNGHSASLSSTGVL
jgi:WD40 repeat protein